MLGEHKFRGREISMTTSCALNSRPHWHAGDRVENGPVSSWHGKGWCLTTPAAFTWLLTGFSRKSWSAS